MYNCLIEIFKKLSYIGYQEKSVHAGTKATLEAMTRVWSRELAAMANAVNSAPPGAICKGEQV